MKKTIIILLFVMVFCLLLSSCNMFEKTEIHFEYSSEILINKEVPDSAFVWAGRVETPTSGASILSSALPDDYFFGILSPGSIQEIEYHDMDEYVKAEKLPELHKILKISIKELNETFNYSNSRKACWLWDDAALYRLLVPDNDQTENTNSPYAGKYVFIEYRENEDKSYIQSLSPSEYDNRNDQSFSTPYEGRIGDRYYLTYGYYDLSEHCFKAYSSESDLPPYGIHPSYNTNDIFEKLKENSVLNEYVTDSSYKVKSTLIKDRIYIMIPNDCPYYTQNDEHNYDGSEILLIMVDAQSYEVLYAERFISGNYNLGKSMILYQKGNDGILYDLYIPE